MVSSLTPTFPGVVITSASSQILGTLYWNPVQLLAAIQEHYHSSPHGSSIIYTLTYILIYIDCSVRGGVFFASVGLAFSQLALNTVLNSVSTGMDIAGLWPQFINIRRGAYLLAIVCVHLTRVRIFE
jgi:nucleobase:cation symporter-1, NCS1 family